MGDDAFREELVTFSLQSKDGSNNINNSAITPSFLATISSDTNGRAADAAPEIDVLHRPRLLPIVIRLVYGRLAGSGSRGRAGGHGGPAARRTAVLAFLSGLASEELAELFALMVRPFLEPARRPSATETLSVGGDGERTDEGPADWDEVRGGAEQARAVLDRITGVTAEHLGGVSSSRQAGFLKMVKEVAKQLGQRALPYVEGVLRLVLALLEHSNTLSESEGETRQAQQQAELVGNREGFTEGEEDAEEEEDGMEVGDQIPVEKPDAALTSSAAAGVTKFGKMMTSGTLRALCLRALSELFSQFSSTFDFASHQGALWPPLAQPILRLPGSTVGAVRVPALLALAGTLTENQQLLPMLSAASNGGGGALVPAVLDCISAGSDGGRAAGPAVLGAALLFVERLLMYDGGSLLGPHLNRLISNFTARLVVIGTSGKGHGGAGGLDAHTEQALAILARIVEMATSGTFGYGGEAVDASSMSQLITLLMPALQPDRRASDEAKSAVLRTFSALARRVDAAGARRAWPALSRLLAPAGARPSVMAAAGPRGELVRALEALAGRSDLAASAVPAIALVAELNARDEVALDEPDFTRAVPAYNSLSEGSGWEDIIVAGGKFGEMAHGNKDVTALGGALAAAPVAHHCFHAMHEQEVALRGAAGAALKRLVREVQIRERASAYGERCPWEGLMRTVVMPGLRAGMACRIETVRKGYISLLRETVSAYQHDTSGDGGSSELQVSEDAGIAAEIGSASVVPSDMWMLARDDDPESDFFLNACHMQIHRRARALAKARKAIEDSEAAVAAPAAESTAGEAMAVVDTGETEGQAPLAAACPFRVSTLVHFLLPLALHPLYEAAKATEAGLVGQAIQLVGAIARHLPWTHYNAALRNLMQQVSSGGGDADVPEKERAMISAMCEVLNCFHFALIPPTRAPNMSSPGEPVTATLGTIELVAKVESAVDDAGGGSAVESGGSTASPKAGNTNGDAVWRAVTGRLLSSLRAMLTKDVRSKSGGTEKVLRAPVALGMLTLIRRLPATEFELQLQPLIMAVCQSLKSRDSHARDTARDTLAKMARELGPKYLQQVRVFLRKAVFCLNYCH